MRLCITLLSQELWGKENADQTFAIFVVFVMHIEAHKVNEGKYINKNPKNTLQGVWWGCLFLLT